MKYLLTLLSCVMMASAFSEMVGNVEFQLPKEAKDWVIGNKIENEKATVVVYMPKEEEGKEVKEGFGTVVVNEAPKDFDISSAKEGITAMLPEDVKVDFKVLDKSKDGGLFEWSAAENGKEIMHGWGRGIVTKDSTIMLSYQTEDVSDIPKTRSIWLPVLKDAHIK